MITSIATILIGIAFDKVCGCQLISFYFLANKLFCLSQYLDAANNFVPDSKGFCFISLIFKLLLCLYSSFWLALF